MKREPENKLDKKTGPLGYSPALEETIAEMLGNLTKSAEENRKWMKDNPDSKGDS